MAFQQVTESENQQGSEKSEDGKKWLKVYCASGYTQYKPYMVGDGTSGNSPAAIAPATLAIEQRLWVPQGDTTTTAGWYWGVVQGTCECLVDGTTDVASDAYLEIINAGVALILDHADAPTVGGVGISLEAVTADAATQATVWLHGMGVQVAAA